ncbi:protein of unknown function (plasmid) [Cupriavidus taiwanensis]|uniref:Uncharacterized protein n=1 Tax=Cupriavidus taiwanensis TaxID=164546 RepID=A0A375IPN1_9BURK|nr:protein of unknown function [Cupriavidus taiwanensis]
MFSEQYDALVASNSKETKDRFDRAHIKRNVVAIRCFKAVLSKLGQKTLLQDYNAHFPKEPAPEPMTLEELHETFRKAMSGAKGKKVSKK